MKGRTENIKGPGDLPAHSRRTRECFHAIRECAKIGKTDDAKEAQAAFRGKRAPVFSGR